MSKQISLIKITESRYPRVNSKEKRKYALYRCHCGKEFEAMTTNANRGNTKSCGCVNIQRIKHLNMTHGQSNHKLYSIYRGMIARCYIQKSTSYKNYGGRGIKVCDRWKNSVIDFIEDLLPIYKDGLEINRIDNDGNYEINNVNFVTHKVNSSATRILQTNNTSGYRGVIKDKNKYRAEITVDYKSKHIGSFNTKEEAAIAYNQYVDLHSLPHTKNII